MKKETMGMMIAARRKELKMTQLELADKMGVAVVVLSALGELDVKTAVTMLA